MGGSFYLYFDAEEEVWVDSIFFFGASIFNKLENDNNNYCIDSYNNWYRYNGTKMLFSEQMSVTCQTIEKECCKTINITSTNDDLIDENDKPFYQKNARYVK